MPVHRPELGRCWLWLGPVVDNGYAIYGRFHVGPRDAPKWFSAHRVSYAIANPGFPWSYTRETELDHECNQKLCVNPKHLRVLSHKENLRRGAHVKLSLEIAEEIRRLHAAGEHSYSKLATMYGVARYHIRAIVKRKYWN